LGAQPEHPGSGYPNVPAYRAAALLASDAAAVPGQDDATDGGLHAAGGAGSETAATAVLADAYPLWLEAVERVLRPLGITVAAKATSAADAVQLLEQLKPALLVTDLNFGNPGEGGIPYLKRALAVCPDVKVIVLATFEESRTPSPPARRRTRSNTSFRTTWPPRFARSSITRSSSHPRETSRPSYRRTQTRRHASPRQPRTAARLRPANPS
jgi:CheY-like chemotaxis protein